MSCVSKRVTAIFRAVLVFFLMMPRPPPATLFPYTTLFRSDGPPGRAQRAQVLLEGDDLVRPVLHANDVRSEEHTSELQSHSDLVCRLLLEKKKDQTQY